MSWCCPLPPPSATIVACVGCYAFCPRCCATCTSIWRCAHTTRRNLTQSHRYVGRNQWAALPSLTSTFSRRRYVQCACTGEHRLLVTWVEVSTLRSLAAQIRAFSPPKPVPGTANTPRRAADHRAVRTTVKQPPAQPTSTAAAAAAAAAAPSTRPTARPKQEPPGPAQPKQQSPEPARRVAGAASAPPAPAGRFISVPGGREVGAAAATTAPTQRRRTMPPRGGAILVGSSTQGVPAGRNPSSGASRRPGPGRGRYAYSSSMRGGAVTRPGPSMLVGTSVPRGVGAASHAGQPGTGQRGAGHPINVDGPRALGPPQGHYVAAGSGPLYASAAQQRHGGSYGGYAAPMSSMPSPYYAGSTFPPQFDGSQYGYAAQPQVYGFAPGGYPSAGQVSTTPTSMRPGAYSGVAMGGASDHGRARARPPAPSYNQLPAPSFTQSVATNLMVGEAPTPPYSTMQQGPRMQRSQPNSTGGGFVGPGYSPPAPGYSAMAPGYAAPHIPAGPPSLAGTPAPYHGPGNYVGGPMGGSRRVAPSHAGYRSAPGAPGPVNARMGGGMGRGVGRNGNRW